jgi:solute carrier family 25 iron transporter 28/37
MKKEGPRAFYRSYTTQISLNIPFQSLHFMVYESCQDNLNPDHKYNPLTHTISGGMAGAVAAAATTPLDVCKTLLNTQERCALSKGQSSIRGMSEAFRTVYRFQGIPGFFKGMTPRIIYQIPSTAVAWSVYEFFKYFLTQRQQADCDGYIRASKVHVHAAETLD